MLLSLLTAHIALFRRNKPRQILYASQLLMIYIYELTLAYD